MANYSHAETILYFLIIVIGVPLISIQLVKLISGLREVNNIVRENQKFLEKHIHRKNMFLMLHRLGMKPYG